MSNIHIIQIISQIIWFFPALRQYNEKLFYFFLVLALADPISLLFLFITKIHPAPFFPLVSSLILVLTVIGKEKLKTYSFHIVVTYFILILIPIIIGSRSFYYLLFSLLHIFVIYNIFGLFIKSYLKENVINIFYVLIILYELLNIFKVLNIVFQFPNVSLFLNTTLFFQVILGLYFSIVKESSPKNFFRFKTL